MSNGGEGGRSSGVLAPAMDPVDAEFMSPGPRHDRDPPRKVRPRLTDHAGRSLPIVVRVAVHGVIWSTLVVPAVIELSDGWRPIRDDAMISIGSYQVFSAKSPLVGVWSQASAGLPHAIFGLGPLLFWLLAVPVHLDRATVLCGERPSSTAAPCP